MRITDIFKKQNIPKQDTPAEPPIPAVVKKPKSEITNIFQKEDSTIAEIKNALEEPKPAETALTSAEELYSLAIREIKSIFKLLSENKNVGSDFLCIEGLIANIGKLQDELITYADKATPDIYIYGHSANVCIYSILLGKALGITGKKLYVLGLCALLHDIGMAKLMDIAGKTTELSSQEYSAIKKHVINGSSMIKTNFTMSDDLSKAVAEIILLTHERMDGSGYPGGLKGNEIHELSRIISITDIYEAITHPRAYRARQIPHMALKTLINHAGKELDTEIVKRFVENMSIYPPGSYVMINTDEIGKVTKVNPGMPTRPKVKVIISPSGARLEESRIIDLATNPVIFVKEPIDETKLVLEDKKLSLELKASRWWVKSI